MRISLYKHELEAICALTVSLVRLRQDECSHLAIENVGPEIFEKLIDAMYKRGNYEYNKVTPWAPVDFSEVKP
jgi:hypothetical protein